MMFPWWLDRIWNLRAHLSPRSWLLNSVTYPEIHAIFRKTSLIPDLWQINNKVNVDYLFLKEMSQKLKGKGFWLWILRKPWYRSRMHADLYNSWLELLKISMSWRYTSALRVALRWGRRLRSVGWALATEQVWGLVSLLLWTVGVMDTCGCRSPCSLCKIAWYWVLHTFYFLCTT